MTIHVGIDTGCHMECDYCYEEGDRDIRGNEVVSDYDIDAIMEQLEVMKDKYPHDTPGLHGGEPLLIRDEDIEKIFKWVYENYESVREGKKSSHIQTAGNLITDKHIEIFEKYNVHVGISLDGPKELNLSRQARLGDEDVTDRMTERTHENLDRLKDSSTGVGVIVVLSETNAGTDEKLEKLLDWMDELNRKGISGHYNPALPYDWDQNGVILDSERLKEIYLRTWEWMKEEEYRVWNPMRDYVDNLLGLGLSNCVNNKCDVFNAGAAKIVGGDGETSGCGKTAGAVGDGVMFLQGDSNDSEYNDSNERYEMLKQVPEEEGGCKGCEYWNGCQGGCPSAAEDGDWRNRTRWCGAKKALYGQIEKDMRTLFPNITLFTDYPWNAKLAEQATRWNMDFKPFGAMRPGVQGRSSTWGGYEHPFGTPEERVDESVLPEQTFEEQVDEWEKRHGEEVVSSHQDSGEEIIHADSDQSE